MVAAYCLLVGFLRLWLIVWLFAWITCVSHAVLRYFLGSAVPVISWYISIVTGVTSQFMGAQFMGAQNPTSTNESNLCQPPSRLFSRCHQDSRGVFVVLSCSAVLWATDDHIVSCNFYWCLQYGNYIYGFSSIRTGILDYLREGFPWPVAI